MTTPPPYVPAEVIRGRLVRVCPTCHEQITERTDDDGNISDHFTEHWEAEHREEPEPERLNYYVLALQPRDDGKSEGSRRLSEQALHSLRKHNATHENGKPIVWTLVGRAGDLPEGAPVVTAAAVIHRLFDPDGGGYPLLRRQGDELVSIPREETDEERERRVAEHMRKSGAISDRAHAANHILIARREHRLPKFKVLKAERGTPAVMEKYEAWRERREPLEAKITKAIDDAQKRSWTRLYHERSDYQEPLDEAIAAAGITEEEVAAQIQATKERMAEVDRMLDERKEAAT